MNLKSRVANHQRSRATSFATPKEEIGEVYRQNVSTGTDLLKYPDSTEADSKNSATLFIVNSSI